MSNDIKTRQTSQVLRDRETKYFTNGVTISFITWLGARLQVPNATIFDLAMHLLHEELVERISELPRIDVADYDLDGMIKKSDILIEKD